MARAGAWMSTVIRLAAPRTLPHHATIPRRGPVITTDMTTASVAIPRCEYTGITLPECSCRPCLEAMLERVGFSASPQVASSAATE
jgi:hypothetical protein